MVIQEGHERENGLVTSSYDIRDYTIACGANEEYPPEFECKFVPVKNQFSSPTCAAFAGSEIVEYFNLIQTGSYVEFSTEFLYGWREEDYYKGPGMSLRDLLNTLKTYGDVPVSMLPGNSADYVYAEKAIHKDTLNYLYNAKPNRISTYFKITDENQMKYALMHYGYLLVNMPIHKKYSVKTGVYEPESDEITGSHAVVIVGWSENGWTVQNSWGTGWGLKGRFILPFGFKFNEVWGVTDTITGEEIKKPYSGKLIGFIARLINVIINFFREHKRRK